jgi:hypothetical protein
VLSCEAVNVTCLDSVVVLYRKVAAEQHAFCERVCAFHDCSAMSRGVVASGVSAAEDLGESESEVALLR